MDGFLSFRSPLKHQVLSEAASCYPITVLFHSADTVFSTSFVSGIVLDAEAAEVNRGKISAFMVLMTHSGMAKQCDPR